MDSVRKIIYILFFIVSLSIACTTKSDYQAIDTDYTVHDLVKPVAAINQLLLSADYFDQFFYTDNNDFARIFYEYFIYDQPNFKINQSIRLRIDNFKTNEVGFINKSYSGEDPEGNHIWVFTLSLNSKNQFFEVTSHSSGIPLKFQFLDQDSGFYYEKIPITAKVFFEDVEKLGEVNFKEILNTGKDRLIEQRANELFNKPANLGVEILETEWDKIETVHFHDYFPDKGEVDYWINNNVPGSLVKIVYRDDQGNPVSEIKLIKIENDSNEEINDFLISRQPPYDRGVPGLTSDAVSEGSINKPVQIIPGITHFGSVGVNGQSYYSLFIENISQVKVKVRNLFGRIKLISFGNDQSFQNIKGDYFESDMSNFDFFTEGNRFNYFVIQDRKDLYSQGEFYEIEVHQDKFLEPHTVSEINRITKEARELEPGKNHLVNIGESSLYYFKTTVLKASNLIISIEDKSRAGKLFWYNDINGIYNYVTYSYENGNHILNLKGVSPGTECFYYFNLPDYTTYENSKLIINVSEL